MESMMQNVDTLFTNLESFTQKEGLIGKPVTHSNKTFLPVVSLTLGVGGGDSKTKNQAGQANTTSASMAMGGGASGLGAKLCTDAVIVIDNNNVMVAPIGAPGNISQIVDKVPQIISNMKGQQSGQQGGQQATQQNQQQGKMQ